MKITLTSSLGNIGRPLAKLLIEEGHKVNVISHSPERQSEIERINGIPRIGSLEDIDFLTSVFTNSDAIFLMNPPDYSQVDIREYYRKGATNYAEAIKKSNLSRIVLLSSFGAHLSHGTGPILGSHFAENIVKQVPNINLSILRPGYFYYNLYNYVDMIKYTDQIMANYGSSKFPLVSPKDIAVAAAEEVVKETSSLYRYVVSSEHTGQEIATALGTAIGKPSLKWKIVSDEEVKQGMEQNGIPIHIANLFTEMYHSLEDGRLVENYINNIPSRLGEEKLIHFASDFAKLYHST